MTLPASIRLRGSSPMGAIRAYPTSPEGASFHLADSTKSVSHRSGRGPLREAGRRWTERIVLVVRESGFPEQWRLLVLLVLFSFLAAGFAARALMAGFEDTWTEAALASVRRENQELRLRQEILREQTAAALAQLEALEATEASFARKP